MDPILMTHLLINYKIELGNMKQDHEPFLKELTFDIFMKICENKNKRFISEFKLAYINVYVYMGLQHIDPSIFRWITTNIFDHNDYIIAYYDIDDVKDSKIDIHIENLKIYEDCIRNHVLTKNDCFLANITIKTFKHICHYRDHEFMLEFAYKCLNNDGDYYLGNYHYANITNNIEYRDFFAKYYDKFISEHGELEQFSKIYKNYEEYVNSISLINKIE
jgi:hypothetical protein